MREANGLVNCTALGMHSYPGSAFPKEYINDQHWAFDAVYTPLKTAFLQRCEEQGLTCINGFDLWIYQGLDAFKLFTGITVEAQEEVISTALSWLD
jgi:shikimate dehydrogenase